MSIGTSSACDLLLLLLLGFMLKNNGSTCMGFLVVFLLVSKVNGDGLNAAEWRWVSGASTTNQLGSCGAAGQYSAGYTPGGRQDLAMTTAYNGHIYLFAGKGYHTTGGAGMLGDIWVYRQTCSSCKGEWAWLGGKSNSMYYQGYYTGSTPYPGGRSDSVIWFTHPNQLNVHGGNGIDGVPNSAGFLSDFWSFNTDTYAWTFLKGSSVRHQVAVYGTKGTPAAGNVPGCVRFHRLLTSKSDGTAIIFGGWGYDTTSSGYLSDTWRYTSGTTQWTWINGPSVKDQLSVGGSSGVYSSTYYPGGRQSSAVMDTGDLVYLFGGEGRSSSTNGYLADVWAYNTVTNEWAYIAGESSAVGSSALASYGSLGSFSASNHPGSRIYNAGCSDPNSDLIMLFGGQGYGETASIGKLNDFWAFNISTKQWSWTSGDSVINQNGNYTDSVWFSTSNKPGSKGCHTMPVDIDLGLIYVFGGSGYPASGGIGYLNDFWATKGPTVVVGMSPTPSTPVPVLKPVEWRWMSGISTANQNSVCGTAGQYSSGYSPGSRNKAATVTGHNNHIYLFGGEGYHATGGTGQLGDAWVYRQTCWSCKGEWAWMGGKSDSMNYQGFYNGSTPHPGARFSTIWFTPPNKLHVHGGHGYDGLMNYGRLSDLWSFNTDTYAWIFLKGSSVFDQVAAYGTNGTPAAGNVPGAMRYHNLLTSESDRTAIIFGGYGYDASALGYLSDTWIYTNDTAQWTWINGPGIRDQYSVGGSSGVYSSTYYPGGRYSNAVMDTGDLVYLFGGTGRSSSALGHLADLWAYNTVTNEWAYIAGKSTAVGDSALGSYGSLGLFNATNHPGSRRYNAGSSDPNSDLIMLFGGSGYGVTTTLGELNDFWAFNISTKQWSLASGDTIIDQNGNYADSVWFSSSNKPGGRQACAMSVSKDLGVMFLFGGYGHPESGTGRLNDFWATKGPTVVVGMSPTPSPLPTPVPVLKPVEWRWMSGASTTIQLSSCGMAGQLSTGYTPGARYSGPMTTAYNGHIYLFGGYGYPTAGGSGHLGDVWVYRQTCWSCKGEWAWLGGKSNETDNQGYYIGSTPYPGGRYGPVAWFTPPNKLHIHGGHGIDGLGSDGELSDLWSFNTDTYTWTFLKGSSVKDQVAVYGTKGIPAAGSVPGAVWSHALLTSKSDGTAIIFGGQGYDTASTGYLSGTWKYTSGTTQWTWINGPSVGTPNSVGGSSGVYSSTYYPGGRYVSAVMDTIDLAYLFGGIGRSSSSSGRLADLWTYNTVTNEWAYIAGESSATSDSALGSYGSLGSFSASNHPGSRRYTGGSADSNSNLIMLFGGQGYDETTSFGHLNDFWAFNVSTKQWSWTSGDSVINQNGNYADSVWFSSSNKPGARYAHTMSANNDLGLMYVFGGGAYPASGGSGNINDFWATKGPTVVVGVSPTPSSIPTTAPLYPVEWRWISGASTINQLGLCGTAGQFSAGYTPGSRAYLAMTTAYNGRIYLFGGNGYPTAGGSGYLGDVWVYRQTCWSCEGEWAWLGGKSDSMDYQGYYTGSTSYPGGRPGSVAWFTPPNKLHVHGGYGFDGVNAAGYLPDLWSFNTDTYAWTFLKGSSVKNQLAVYGTKGTPAAGNVPGGTRYHMFLTSKSDGTAIIFGGHGFDTTSGSYLSDTWKYTSGTTQWTWINGPSVGTPNSVGGSSGVYSSTYYPGGRFSSAVMDATDLVYLFGGYGESSSTEGYLADLWAYNTVTNEWAYIAGESSAVDDSALGSYGSLGSFGASNHPSSRAYTDGSVDPNSDLIMLFGGYSYDEETTLAHINDFWAFNVSTKQWSWASGNSVINQNGNFADSVWFSSSNKPGGRQMHSASVDNDLGLMYMFGGNGYPASGGAGKLNDFWATKGPTVVVGVSPTPSPLPTQVPVLKPVEWRWMSGHSTTSGFGACGIAGQYSTGYSPGIRNKAPVTAAYNDLMYLFGGSGYPTAGVDGYLGDVWVYRQTCWSCSGEWAWLGGKSDVAGYQGYYNGTTPYPGGRHGSVSWFTPPNQLHVHGGWGKDGVPNAAGRLADLWSFNTDTYSWTFLKGPSVMEQVAVYGTMGTPTGGNLPGAVIYHNLLTSKSDGTAIIFGGWGFASASGKLSDTWKYTSGITQWTWINGPSLTYQQSACGLPGVFSSTYYPGGRSVGAVMDTTELIYLFGGQGKSSTTLGYLADLWAFNAATNEWAYIAGESTAVSDSALGSYGSLGSFSASNHPGSRSYFNGFSDQNSDLIMLFGGQGYDETTSLGYLDDFWAFNVTTKQWSWASGDSVIDRNGNYADSVWFSSSNKPGCRGDHTTSVNSELGLMYMFGGIGYPASGGTGNLNDFWATKGPTVVVGVSPTPSPAPSPVPVLKPVEWRWMSGASTGNQLGSCGAIGQYSTGYSPGGRYAAAMTTAYNGHIYLFGGIGYHTAGGTGFLGDVWVYRQTCWSSKGEWAWLGGRSDTVNYQGYYTGSSPYPGGRRFSVAWLTSPNELHVHGGTGHDGQNNEGYLSDLWSFNSDTYAWRFLKGSSIKDQIAVYGTKGTPTAGNIPGAVIGHMLLTCKHSGTAIIFGGFGYDAIDKHTLADTWKYMDGTTQWTWVNGPGVRSQNSVGGSSGVYSSTYYPGSRHYSAVMDTTDLVYLFGGDGRSSSTAGYLADLWAYNTVTNEWAYIIGESSAVSASVLGSYGSLGSFSASNHPGNTRLVAGCSDPNSNMIMLFVGQGRDETTSPESFSDFWAFNVSTKQWSWASGDSVINQNGNFADSVWFSSSNKPGARYQHMMSVNNDLGLMYLFGGQGYPSSGGTTRLNDFWATKGPAVVVGVSPTPSPLPTPVPVLKPVEWRWMSGASAANQNGVYGTAGQYSTGYTPSGRFTAAMTTAYNGHIYLFGGQGHPASGYLGDVWVYHQTCWSCKGEWAWLGGKSDSIDYQGYYTGSTPYPGGRFGSVAWFTTPSLLYVHGGWGKDGVPNAVSALSDLWSFNTDTYTWAFLKGSSVKDQVAVYGTKGTSAADNVLGAVHYHNLLTSKSDGTAIIFGGFGFDNTDSSFISDTWKYSSQWTWINGPGHRYQYSVGGLSGVYSSAHYPGGRDKCSVMDRSNAVYLLGGRGLSSSTSGHLADLWAFNKVTNEWAYIVGESTAVNDGTLGSYGSLGSFSASNHPGSRVCSAGYSDPNSNLILSFGGQGFDVTTVDGYLSEFWAFNVSTKLWSWVSGDSVKNHGGNYADSVWFSASNKPGARGYHTTSVNNELGLMYISGGWGYPSSGGLGNLNDFWATKGPMVVVGVSPTATPAMSPTTSSTVSPTWVPGFPTPTTVVLSSPTPIGGGGSGTAASGGMDENTFYIIIGLAGTLGLVVVLVIAVLSTKRGRVGVKTIFGGKGKVPRKVVVVSKANNSSANHQVKSNGQEVAQQPVIQMTVVQHNQFVISNDMEQSAPIGGFAYALYAQGSQDESQLNAQQGDVMKINQVEANGWAHCSVVNDVGESTSDGWYPTAWLSMMDINPFGQEPILDEDEKPWAK